MPSRSRPGATKPPAFAINYLADFLFRAAADTAEPRRTSAAA
jgi:hypothetical protein